MNVENDLKKDGITVIEPLDQLSITLIAKFVAEKFTNFFSSLHINYQDLFIKVSRLKMYIAEITDGMSEANYFYKNEAIYFKKGLNLDTMKELTIHEFIHHFQEQKDEKGTLYRLGLCDFTGIATQGLALNEASVQLLSSKILGKEIDSVKYYGIEFSTISPSYYPLLCNLVNQIAYITGDNVLFDSTLNNTTTFKDCFEKLCGKNTLLEISKNFDKILNAEEQIIKLTSHLQENEIKEKEIAKASTQIGKSKKIIQNTFIKTQNKILTSYFNTALLNLHSVQDIEEYRKKLYAYKDLLGTTENYTYFNDYYIEIMTKLDEIYESFTNPTALVPYKRSLWQIILSKIKKVKKLPKVTENFSNK